MHNQKYILDGKVPKPVDLMTWASWFEIADRHVGRTNVGVMDVSTVFLGIDHSFDSGPPLLFETMIFNMPGPSVTNTHKFWTWLYRLFGKDYRRYQVYTGEVEYQERCSTWEEAEVMHQRAVAHAKRLLKRNGS